MIPLKILMDIETNPIVKEGEVWAYPEKLDLSAVGILTKGTEQGNPTVTVRMETPDGKFVLGQTTLRLFVSAAKAFEAKYARYGEFFQGAIK